MFTRNVHAKGEEKMKRHKIPVVLAGILMLLTMFWAKPAFAAGVNVATMADLENAIGGGKPIFLTQDINVTKGLTIPANQTVEITGNGHAFTSASGVDNMFTIKDGATVTFDNIIFDGQQQGRILDSGEANVTIKNSTLKNATTEPFTQKIVDDKDTQRYEGGAIYAAHTTLNLEDTIFENNHTKAEVPSPGAPHGGAIVSYSANITVKGGKFINNYTGAVTPQPGANGEGGAIKLHPGSTLTINDANVTKKDTTVFEGNHLDASGDDGGRQGGAIEATQSTAYIYGTTFQIKGPFNTGGAIKFENCQGSHKAIVKNCNFAILPNQGGWEFGVAGGAITSESANLTIDQSTFQTGKGTNVAEAGGLIQVLGSGTFDLMNSTLTGSGSGWNQTQQLKTAKFGGAINFYNGSTVKAKIENTTIENFTSEISGAGIGISTEAASQLDKTTPENMANRTCPAAITLELINTKLLNNATYSFDNGSYGGGMFIGSGSTVTMTGGQISSSASSSTAAGIYNEGHLTLQGGAQVVNNNAYYMAGGILNDGYLKIDDATVSGTARKDWKDANQHKFNAEEMAGQNIYAAKNVIITPKAVFGKGGDIRVLHGQSAVLLTGHYPEQLNISISESQEAKKAPNNYPANIAVQESVHRHVGYIVAKGAEGYEPTEKDAQNLHYVTKDKDKDTTVSAFDDHTGIGKWDYVLDPEAHNIVLGQRAKMTYHANYDDKNAKFEDRSKAKEQLYTFFGSGNGEPKVSVNNEKVKYLQELDEKPVSKWIFDGWYNHTPKQPPVDDNTTPFQNTKKNNVANSKVNFADAYFVDTQDEITEIVDPNALHVYAGWKPLEITLEKVWDDATAKTKAQQAKITLTSDPAGTNESFTADRNTLTKIYDELDKYREDGKTEITYTVDESSVPDGYTKKITTKANGDGSIVNYSVTNTKKDKLYKVVHEFKAADGMTIALPQDIKNWTPADQTDKVDGTTVKPSDFANKEYNDTANNGKWEFVSWNKTEDTINGADVKFVGTWKFTKTSPTPKKINIQVKKVWDDQDDKDKKRPMEITVQLLANDQPVEGKTLQLTAGNQWTARFEGLDEKLTTGTEIVYTVEETQVPDGYTASISGDAKTGFTITNSHTPTTPDPNPNPNPNPNPDPNPNPNPNPDPNPNPEPNPNPTPDPTPNPKPNPEPKPNPNPDPTPTPEPTPTPKPEPKPEPKPVAPPKKPEAPKTGEEIPLVMGTAMTLLSAGAYLGMKKKK